MNIFQKRIENLCDEIIGRILALMQANSVSEVILKDNDNPVYVIWFDKTGDPCECSVHKVTAVGEGITLEVHDKITGENYKVTSRHEAALANPVWLNDILEAMTNIFQIPDFPLRTVPILGLAIDACRDSRFLSVDADPAEDGGRAVRSDLVAVDVE